MGVRALSECPGPKWYIYIDGGLEVGLLAYIEGAEWDNLATGREVGVIGLCHILQYVEAAAYDINFGAIGSEY